MATSALKQAATVHGNFCMPQEKCASCSTSYVCFATSRIHLGTSTTFSGKKLMQHVMGVSDMHY
jgi:hypothetical protein